jgi:hypothetical protein
MVRLVVEFEPTRLMAGWTARPAVPPSIPLAFARRTDASSANKLSITTVAQLNLATRKRISPLIFDRLTDTGCMKMLHVGCRQGNRESAAVVLYATFRRLHSQIVQSKAGKFAGNLNRKLSD